MESVQLKALFFYFLTCILISSQNSNNNKSIIPSKERANSPSQFHIVMSDNELTATDQKVLTADRIIQNLSECNQHYLNNKLTSKNDTAMIRQALLGQYPEAFVLPV